MQTWDAIRSRRNVPAYRPDPIAESDLLRIAAVPLAGLCAAPP